MTVYVAGFLFNQDSTKTLLIQKNHPEWQAGLFNAPGGKVEQDEHPDQAMTREYLEETGLTIYTWDNFLTLKYPQDTIHFYRRWVFDNTLDLATSRTDEQVFHIWLEQLMPESDMVPNLYWILPMALDHSVHSSMVKAL